MKKSVINTRKKFVENSTKSDFFEVHGGSYYYVNSKGTICLVLPIDEGITEVKDNEKNMLRDILYKTSEACWRKLDVPTLAELKQYRKEWSAFNKANAIKLSRKDFVYQWDDGIALKLDYLILAMEMIPGLVLMADKESRDLYGYSTSCNAEIIICPVRVRKELWNPTNIYKYHEWYETTNA